MGDVLQNGAYCDFETVFESATLRLKEEQRYRTFVDLERIAGRLPSAVWHSSGGPREVTIWCSNDYLGMSQNTAVVQAMVDTARRLGTGSGGTRNIAGTNHPLVDLERELADLHAKQAALVFTSGYVANQSSISTIAKLIPNCLILSDELNHNSMIEGVNQSNCAKQVFRHNDLGHLKQLLTSAGEGRPKIVLFEKSLLHGRRLRCRGRDLRARQTPQCTDVLRRSPRRGTVRTNGGWRRRTRRCLRTRRRRRRDAGKSLWRLGRLYCRQRAAHRCGTVVCAWIYLYHGASAAGVRCSFGRHTSLEILDHERLRHQENVARLKRLICDASLPLLPTDSHILPLMVGDSEQCQKASALLLEEYAIYIQPINYPTVPKGAERLRITPSPFHTDLQIDCLVEALVNVWDRLGLWR